jgi:hypothetical protein
MRLDSRFRPQAYPSFQCPELPLQGDELWVGVIGSTADASMKYLRPSAGLDRGLTSPAADESKQHCKREEQRRTKRANEFHERSRRVRTRGTATRSQSRGTL